MKDHKARISRIEALMEEVNRQHQDMLEIAARVDRLQGAIKRESEASVSIRTKKGKRR
jgi:hypothetical protein